MAVFGLNFVFKKQSFRVWFLMFFAASLVLVPVYYFGWPEVVREEGGLLTFFTIDPMT